MPFVQLFNTNVGRFFYILVVVTFLVLFYQRGNLMSNYNIPGFNIPLRRSEKVLYSTLLKIQEKQMYRNINALFLLETHDQFLIIKLRFGDLIKKYVQWKNYGRNEVAHFIFVLRCYEFTTQEKKRGEVFNITFSLKTILGNTSDAATSDKQLRSIFITNITFINKTMHPLLKYNIPSAKTNVVNEQITVPAPFLMSDLYMYRFLFELIQEEANHTIQVYLNWPTWPLSFVCMNEILRDLITNYDSNFRHNVMPSNYPCTLTNSLVVSSPCISFMTEQMAVSHWLDMQKEASDLNRAITVLFSMSRNNNQNWTSVKKSHRRLHPFEKSLDTAVCSRAFKMWILDYQQWHLNISRKLMQLNLNYSEIRDHILKNNISFLLYEKTAGDHGVSDRMVHLISTYLMALLTRRFFVFDPLWPEFERVFRISLNISPDIVIPWLSEVLNLNKVENLTPFNASYISAKTYSFGIERYARDFNYETQFPERVVTMNGYTGNVIHTITSPTSIYSKFLQTQLEMTAENLFGCLFHSLLIPHLASLIGTTRERHKDERGEYQVGYSFREILQMLLSHNFHSIGVQIRIGDHSFVDGSQLHDNPSLDLDYIRQYYNFFTCVYELADIYKRKGYKRSSVNNNQSVIVYLVSDNMRLRRAALRRWQLPHTCLNESIESCGALRQLFNLVTATNLIQHVARTNDTVGTLQTAMIEAFLFSICQEHIFEVYSGFGRVPAFFALNFRNIYTFTRGQYASCLDPEHGTKLEVSAHHQAGIR